MDNRHPTNPAPAARVALVSMPFAPVFKPSQPLGQLKACLSEAELDADVLYLNFNFADRVGPLTYQRISTGQPAHADLLGEWVFAKSTIDAAAEDAYIANCLLRTTLDRRTTPDDAFIDAARRARRLAPEFIDDCVTAVDWGSYAAVVFAIPFLQQQLNAALRLCEALKRTHPDVLTVLGGSGVEGEVIVGILRTHDAVDLGVSGEWDRVLPLALRDHLSGDRDPARHPGVLRGDHMRALPGDRLAALAECPPMSPAVRDLDSLPTPDHEEYFRAFAHSPFASTNRRPTMVMETSRGCWWGEKHHCTFCGLNQQNMPYRAKSADRALAELAELEGRYGEKFGRLEMTDTIMPMGYLREFFPRLPRRSTGRRFYYETKSNLKPADLAALSDAGADIIQPGIESFSTPVLKQMDKGVTAIQNIQFLKSAKESGISLVYNLLLGNPGETQAEIDAMHRLLPSLYHLQPPGWWGRIHLDRYSPLFLRPDEYGVRRHGPAPAYRYAFPDIDDDDRDRIAWFFAYDVDGAVDVDARALVSRVQEWTKRADAGASLTHMRLPAPPRASRGARDAVDADPQVLVLDGRDPSRPRRYLLHGTHATLYLAAASLTTARSLARTHRLPAEEVDAVLDELAAHGLVLRLDQRELALGIDAGDRAAIVPDGSQDTPDELPLVHLGAVSPAERVLSAVPT